MKLNGCQPAKRGGATAYSLPEAIIAVAIISLMMISLYAGFSAGFTIVRSARENLRATQIMLQRMETLRLYTWNELLYTNNFQNVTFVESFDPLGQVAGSGGTVYTGDIALSVPTNLPSAYENDMLMVTVSVYWTNYNNKVPQVSRRQMQTYVARYGLQNYVRGK
jgi:type II secretory pathway pseudopilin PulG